MDILSRCLALGASGAAELRTKELSFDPELRKLCEQNLCGSYGRNHGCPPAAGDIHSLIARVRSFERAVIWQNIYPLEDSYDIEGMQKGKRHHNAMALAIAEELYACRGREQALVLGAGGCTLCEACAALEQKPCRCPGRALSSLEAHGLLVSKIAELCPLRYTNGENTVTYFGGAFIR